MPIFLYDSPCLKKPHFAGNLKKKPYIIIYGKTGQPGGETGWLNGETRQLYWETGLPNGEACWPNMETGYLNGENGR